MTKYEACDVGEAGWKRCVFVKWKTVMPCKDRAAGLLWSAQVQGRNQRYLSHVHLIPCCLNYFDSWHRAAFLTTFAPYGASIFSPYSQKNQAQFKRGWSGAALPPLKIIPLNSTHVCDTDRGQMEPSVRTETRMELPSGARGQATAMTSKLMPDGKRRWKQSKENSCMELAC